MSEPRAGQALGPRKPPEVDDPMELVSVAYPAGDEPADRDTARCLIEEYALLGWSSERIGALFRSPAYRAPYAILRRRGPGFVDEIMADVFGPRRGR